MSGGTPYNRTSYYRKRILHFFEQFDNRSSSLSYIEYHSNIIAHIFNKKCNFQLLANFKSLNTDFRAKHTKNNP